MEFRRMVTITLYTRQQKRHWCIEQSFGLCGRGRGWDDLGEWHWNTYNIIYGMSRQSRFEAWHWILGAGALGWPRGMVWGGKKEEGSGWGTRVYLWQIHFDIWQNQYNIVKLKKKKCPYFPKQSTDLLQFLSKFQWHISHKKQNNPNIFMETGKTPNRKAVLRKSKAGSITLPDFKLYYKAKVIN